jgi:hypothetical protein
VLSGRDLFAVWRQRQSACIQSGELWRATIKDVDRLRRHAFALGTDAVIAVVVAALASCSGTPQPTGDPDPGGQLMAAIRPVLAAIPNGTHVISREEVKPRWDSCDGVKSTYGWNDVTVDAEFTANDPPEPTVAAIDQTLRRLGWTASPGSGDGAWYWHRSAIGGAEAVTQLLAGPDVQPRDWSIQATVAAATHPIKAC